MKAKQIVFTAVNKAELLETECPDPKENEVLIKTAYTTISSGTERANLTGDPNINAYVSSENIAHFPRTCGYSGSGIIIATGDKVKDFKVGDRVVRIWGTHKSFDVFDEKSIVKIPDSISLSEASMTYISTFPMAAVRKTRLEIGESAIVMGLGILGIFAVQFLKAAGAVPVIAADPIKERRELALKLGADYALDPFDSNFTETVKELTDGGANVAIEVTGVGKALDQALDCMARFGRIALLGCTRNSDFTIDYYRKVHFPGIQLIGAHTIARNELESAPGNWTHKDDIRAVLKLLDGNRVNFKKMISEIHAPDEAYDVFLRLATDKSFPIGVQFNWIGDEIK